MDQAIHHTSTNIGSVMKGKANVAKPMLMAALIASTLIGWFVPFEYGYEGYCGERTLYRYRFGIYDCDLNEEAEHDFQCRAKVGGFWSWMGLKQLEC